MLLNSFGGRLLPKARERLTGENRGALQEVTFRVPSIHCEGCVDGIRETLATVEGVEGVEAEVGEKLVTVTYRDGAELENDLRERMEAIGHLVS